MSGSLTLPGAGARRFWSLFAGTGMIAASVMTIRHFYSANFPASIFEGAFCDISAFLNCDSSAYSPIAHFYGVPMGFLGMMAGALVVLGAVFPSAAFERTNKFLAYANALGVVGLLGYSVLFLKSLCLLCSGYYVFSLLSAFLFWKYGLPFGFPSVKILTAAAVVFLGGARGFQLYYGARQQAQLGGVAAGAAREFGGLAEVQDPSYLSPFWTARSTERFEDAPLRIVEYADFLCPDCVILHRELKRLKKDYAGKINIAFQFFPLEAKCNTVVDKDLHPGACDLALIAAAAGPERFPAIHDEIFDNYEKAKDPDWRLRLARKYGVEGALTDPAVGDQVRRIIATGAEYEKTSDRYAHGIRSTPTMIINGRMVIGTLPYAHLKSILESLLARDQPAAGGRFMENWIKK